MDFPSPKLFEELEPWHHLPICLLGQSRQIGMGDTFQGPEVGSHLTLRNELSEETNELTKKEILLERAPWWRAVASGNPGELLCLMAHSLGFDDNGISFWIFFGQSF